MKYRDHEIVFILPLLFLFGLVNVQNAFAEIGKVPDPRVTVQVNTQTPTTTSATFLNGQFSKQGDIVNCYITLTNSGDDANGGGLFVQLDGAEFYDIDEDYYESHNFNAAIGYAENAQEIPIADAKISEVYSFNILHKTDPPAAAKFRIRVTSESGYVNINFRGWLFDKDDVVQNPETGQNELYVARYPFHYQDRRYGGNEFTKLYR